MYTLPQQVIVRKVFKNMFNRAPTNAELLTIYNFDYAQYTQAGSTTFEEFFGNPESDYMGVECLECTIEDALEVA